MKNIHLNINIKKYKTMLSAVMSILNQLKTELKFKFINL